MLATRLTIGAIAVASLAYAADLSTPPATDLQPEALKITMRFAGELKPRLQGALEAGGPVSAITICSQEAPQIAKALSEETGWIVRRVSDQPRNQSLAQPDAWERDALARLAQRAASSDGSDTLVISEYANGTFRFMKGQVVEPLCLVCHGPNVADDVSQALAQRYPADRATGYALGQLRGAISLRKRSATE